MYERGPETDEAGHGLERIVYFSDAVFAIAITLLVIDLRLPEFANTTSLDNTQINAVLHELAPKIFSYVLSFSVIGLYWLAHWRRYQWIERSNQGLAALNLFLLGFVAFIPFPTALLGTQGNHTLPVVIYALVQSAVGVFGALSWLYAMRAGLTRPDMPPAVARVGLARAASGPLVFLASLPLALVNPYLAQGCWLLIFPAQLLVQRLAGAAG